MAQWSERSERSWPLPPILIAVLAGAGWWFVGHLPWIAVITEPTDRFEFLTHDLFVAVPMFPDALILMVRYSILGGVCAALAAGPGRRGHPYARLASLAGMTIVMTLALVQSYVAAQLADPEPAGVDGPIIAGLVLASVAASLAGWGFGVLALRGGMSLALVLSLLTAFALGWLWQLTQIMTIRVVPDTGTTDALLSVVEWWNQWVPMPLLLAAALVLVGIRSPGRLVLWPVVFLIAWLTSWLSTLLLRVGFALSYGDSVADGITDTWDSFGDNAVPPTQTFVEHGIAVAIAAAVTLGIAYRNRKRGVRFEQVHAGR